MHGHRRIQAATELEVVVPRRLAQIISCTCLYEDAAKPGSGRKSTPIVVCEREENELKRTAAHREGAGGLAQSDMYLNAACRGLAAGEAPAILGQDVYTSHSDS